MPLALLTLVPERNPDGQEIPPVREAGKGGTYALRQPQPQPQPQPARGGVRQRGDDKQRKDRDA